MVNFMFTIVNFTFVKYKKCSPKIDTLLYYRQCRQGLVPQNLIRAQSWFSSAGQKFEIELHPLQLKKSRGGGTYEKLGVKSLARENIWTIFKQLQDHSWPNIGCAAAHLALPVPPPLKSKSWKPFKSYLLNTQSGSYASFLGRMGFVYLVALKWLQGF